MHEGNVRFIRGMAFRTSTQVRLIIRNVGFPRGVDHFPERVDIYVALNMTAQHSNPFRFPFPSILSVPCSVKAVHYGSFRIQAG